MGLQTFGSISSKTGSKHSGDTQMVNATNITNSTNLTTIATDIATTIQTETPINLYHGGSPPAELSAFVFFVVLGVIVAVYFIIVVFSAEGR